MAWVLGFSDPQKVLQLHHREHGCINAWYGNCSACNHKALQRVVRMTQYITGAKLPAIQDLYTRRCQRKALKMVKYSSHISHKLFSLLPHGQRHQSAKYRSKRVLKQLLPPSHKTHEHLVKWIPRLFAVPLPSHPSLHHCYSLLSSMHSHFNNSTYMYILPQITCAPAH